MYSNISLLLIYPGDLTAFGENKKKMRKNSLKIRIIPQHLPKSLNVILVATGNELLGTLSLSTSLVNKL